MTIAEDRVLKSLDPVPGDVNDWPDFALRDVKIFHQGKGRYADLLEASEATPLCVLGELMPLHDEQEHLALIENPSYTRMKIDNVTNYSFGQDDDGKPVVWAAGRAGWYEISPSDRYLQYFNDTVEAVDLFYFMVDQFQKLSPKRKRLGFQIDPFLTAYQKHTGFRIDDDDEAMETIHKHHKFLMKQMIEERENIDWSQTHLWNHLAETYIDEVEELRAALAALPMNDSSSPGPPSSSPAGPASKKVTDAVTSQSPSEHSLTARSQTVSASDSGSDVESEAESKSASDRKSQHDLSSESESLPESGPRSVADAEGSEDTEESESEDDPPDSGIDWTRPIFDLLNVLRKLSNFDIRNCGIDELATEVMKMPAFPANHKKAVAVIEKHAEPLLRLMNEAKLRKKFNWSTRAIYAELEATLADEVAADIRTPAKRTRDKHRMKSVLRPSGASKSRKRTRDMDADDDEGLAIQTTASALSPVARRQALQRSIGRQAREATAETVGSRDDSPSRQLNGYHRDIDALPVLPPMPEAQEMIDLVVQEARRVGRQNQTSNLQAFLNGWEQW